MFALGIDKFNAYAINNSTAWGLSPESVSYESLFPVTDPEAANLTGPDFHYLDAFQDLDLSAIGFNQSPDESDLWTQAVKEKPRYTFA